MDLRATLAHTMTQRPLTYRGVSIIAHVYTDAQKNEGYGYWEAIIKGERYAGPFMAEAVESEIQGAAMKAVDEMLGPN